MSAENFIVHRKLYETLKIFCSQEILFARKFIFKKFIVRKLENLLFAGILAFPKNFTVRKRIYCSQRFVRLARNFTVCRNSTVPKYIYCLQENLLLLKIFTAR